MAFYWLNRMYAKVYEGVSRQTTDAAKHRLTRSKFNARFGA